MITCAFNEKLMDGVDLWCPITENLHLPLEKTCRERGAGMWWYICSSPRAAPVGEHIEHNPLLAVPKSVYADLFSYTHDPLPMEQHREKLAREIESKISR